MTWTEIVRGGVAVGVLGAVAFWGDFPFGGPHWDPEYIPAYPRKKRPKAWMSSLASQGSGRPGQAVGRFDVETFGFPTNAVFTKRYLPQSLTTWPFKSYRNPVGKEVVFQPPFFRGEHVKLRKGMLCLLFGV